MQLTDLELGWLAGILEGEGTFAFDGHTQKIGLQMTDEDIVFKVERLLSRILNKASIHVGFIYRDARKDMYQIAISGDNARKIMKLVVPHMGTRRRVKIWQSLNRYQQKKKIVDIKTLVSNMSIRKVEVA